MHDRAARIESAEINKGLMALKDCFRALTELDVEQEVVVEKTIVRDGVTTVEILKQFDDDESPDVVERLVVRDKQGARGARSACRSARHRLTTLLKDCFVNPDHATTVVATVSPTPTDVEHSRRTLEHVCAMRGAASETTRVLRVGCERTEREVEATLPVAKWSAARAGVARAAARRARGRAGRRRGCRRGRRRRGRRRGRGRRRPRGVPAAGGVDGKTLVRLTVPRLAAMCGGDRALAQRVCTISCATRSSGVTTPRAARARARARSRTARTPTRRARSAPRPFSSDSELRATRPTARTWWRTEVKANVSRGVVTSRGVHVKRGRGHSTPVPAVLCDAASCSPKFCDVPCLGVLSARAATCRAVARVVVAISCASRTTAKAISP